MPSLIPIFSLRIEERLLDKLRIMASQNKRSLNKEIEYVLDRYVAAYEKEHGPIKLVEEAL